MAGEAQELNCRNEMSLFLGLRLCPVSSLPPMLSCVRSPGFERKRTFGAKSWTLRGSTNGLRKTRIWSYIGTFLRLNYHHQAALTSRES